MINRLRFSVFEVSPLLARLAPVVPAEFVVVVSFERSERTEEEDDDERVPELDESEVLGELYVLG
jgi:hypothetical protein